MWLRASTDTAGLGLHTLGVAALATLVLAACSSVPTKPTESASQPAPAVSDAGKPGSAAAGANGASPNGSATPASVPITARGKADFERAVGFMKAGNVTEAELEFKQVALQFPQLSSPYVNLGILYRKAGHLEQSEEALKTAVERNDGSAVAWTELGATQRLRGEFPSAAASYEKAITADPNFAPAYRNLGVVSDLYLGDPERALTAFERYKELTGEEKPVSGWIAELRQRTGKPPLKRPPAPGASGAAPQGGPAAPGATPDAAPGQTEPGASQTTPDQKPAEPPAGAPPPKAGG
jgi:tetratricopeptide repeat protein